MCFYHEQVREVRLFPRFFGPVVEAFKVVDMLCVGRQVMLVPPVAIKAGPYKLGSWQRAKRHDGSWYPAGFYAFKSFEDASCWGRRQTVTGIHPVVVRVELRGILAEGYQLTHQDDFAYRAMWMRIDRESLAGLNSNL